MFDLSPWCRGFTNDHLVKSMLGLLQLMSEYRELIKAPINISCSRTVLKLWNLMVYLSSHMDQYTSEFSGYVMLGGGGGGGRKAGSIG
jgi:hypothetical protein